MAHNMDKADRVFRKVFSQQDASMQTEQLSQSKDIIAILERNAGSHFKSYRKRFQSAITFKKEPPFPIHIDFETVFGCNIRCIMCTHSYRGLFPSRPKFMEFGLFKKIIDEGKKFGLASIGLDQEGEPLLVSNIIDFIEYAKQQRIVDIFMNSNALLLDREKTESLLHSGLTRLHFSLDALKPKTYAKIRRGSDYRRVVDNILYFCKRKKELKKELPVTRVSFVRMKHNEKELPDFIHFWTSHVDAIAIQEYNAPFNGNIELNKLYALKKINNLKFRCTQPWFRMVVLTDGSVLPCCLLGVSLKMLLGNAYRQSLLSLWKSEAMKKLRQIHKDGEYFKSDNCNICAHNFF